MEGLSGHPPNICRKETDLPLSKAVLYDRKRWVSRSSQPMTPNNVLQDDPQNLAPERER
jgi:hypothetical protein